MSDPLTGAMMALLTAAAIPLVTAAVNVFKPLLERLPWANPNNPADKPAHDATLQLFNVVASVVAMCLFALLFGYASSPSGYWVICAQIVVAALGADFNYRGSVNSSGGGGAAGSIAVLAPSVATVAGALGQAVTAPASPASAPAPAAYVPFHQQAAPSAAPDPAPAVVDASAYEAPAESADGADANGLATQPALAAVTATATASAQDTSASAI